MDAHAPDNSSHRFMQESLEENGWSLDLGMASRGLSIWYKDLTTLTRTQWENEAQTLITQLYQTQKRILYVENIRLGKAN